MQRRGATWRRRGGGSRISCCGCVRRSGPSTFPGIVAAASGRGRDRWRRGRRAAAPSSTPNDPSGGGQGRRPFRPGSTNKTAPKTARTAWPTPRTGGDWISVPTPAGVGAVAAAGLRRRPPARPPRRLLAAWAAAAVPCELLMPREWRRGKRLGRRQRRDSCAHSLFLPPLLPQAVSGSAVVGW